MSASIGLDEPTVWNRTALYNLPLPVIGADGTGIERLWRHAGPRHRRPLRVDQAWGLFQISAMAHLVNAILQHARRGSGPTTLSEISGHPDNKWGGSVMAALQIKNIPTGAGDDIKIDVFYAEGATKQVISTSGGSPSFAMFCGSSFVALPERRLWRHHRRRLSSRRSAAPAVSN